MFVFWFSVHNSSRIFSFHNIFHRHDNHVWLLANPSLRCAQNNTDNAHESFRCLAMSIILYHRNIFTVCNFNTCYVVNICNKGKRSICTPLSMFVQETILFSIWPLYLKMKQITKWSFMLLVKVWRGYILNSCHNITESYYKSLSLAMTSKLNQWLTGGSTQFFAVGACFHCSKQWQAV